MDEAKRRWEKGLGLMQYARKRTRAAQEPQEAPRPAGRPRAPTLEHEALGAALMGLAKA